MVTANNLRVQPFIEQAPGNGHGRRNEGESMASISSGLGQLRAREPLCIVKPSRRSQANFGEWRFRQEVGNFLFLFAAVHLVIIRQIFIHPKLFDDADIKTHFFLYFTNSTLFQILTYCRARA